MLIQENKKMLRIEPGFVPCRVVKNAPYLACNRPCSTDGSGQARQEIAAVLRVVHFRGAVEPIIDQIVGASW
jgi:hypothetical protein